MNKLLFEIAGVVEAPLSKVADLLLTDKSTPLFVPDTTIEVDRAERTIAYQGGWWYRGEYALESHPRGTLITHRVYNAARWGRWGVPLANRFFVGFDDRTRAAFAASLAGIGAALGCPTDLN
ncbi:hypothetical protein [Actinocrispum wychmicini]|uniref:Polyketide cyclase/dehydrase/lipid transport protein n=1 Tax=Actinocrispum wychmicini TaxID=1213861 RepID=A0A4R2JPG9_9PSEU|nr:hypothetical protein [Actinocrispum wychmicini]TCO60887.1 hypothetical protein EV192_103469 [Actinocrispum wychmicini]